MVNLIVDTNILSYSFKGTEQNIPNDNVAISSITANEFLLAQAGDSGKPDYYTIHPIFNEHKCNSSVTNNKFTDRVVIDFNNQFVPYQEFGNEAISEIINKNKPEIYKISIVHLDKSMQKKLTTRLQYILDNGYYCYPLTKSIIDRALDLFSVFTSKYNCKENIRNTINDTLILATAIDKEKKFLTSDKLLNRFTAEQYEATIYPDKDALLIDFTAVKVAEKKKNRESKEYINKGWNYTICRS